METATTDRFLAHLDEAFAVTTDEARAMVGHLHEAMRRGLSGEESSLKMLPAFVGRPRGTERGQFLCLDLGGTNVRVLAVALDGKRGANVTAVSRFAIPEARMRGDGEALFDFIADGTVAFFQHHMLSRDRDYPLAFTFSFPVAQGSLASGRLLSWTKGFSASGVEGRDVVGLLAAALVRKGLTFIRIAALANDTVGTLMAGAYADPACDMGVILGTGTNACYPEKASALLKSPDLAVCGEMIVNMEWGNFDGLRTNAYDRLVDSTSLNPGKQTLEKMISGMYLGEIVRRVLAAMTAQGFLFDGRLPDALAEGYSLRTEHLALLGEDGDAVLPGLDRTPERKAVREIARLVSTRSARLAGTAIAAVVIWMDPLLKRDHVIAVDGTLFEKYPGYRDAMRTLMTDLLGNQTERIRLRLVRDGSGIGSAMIGAVAAAGNATA